MGQLKTYGDVVKFDLSDNSSVCGYRKQLKCEYKYRTYSFNEIYNLVIEGYVDFINELINENGIITPKINKRYNDITSDMAYI
ncbi:MAG: hypothetical protein NC177_15445 [Ruminococcus flavefaciens]|nr:hypothetical protein [Ruminococcus flavefaciens]